MSFNPLTERGIPLEKQLRNWSELAAPPYDKRTVHPYTRSRIIVMNGIEVESVMFSHQFHRHCDDLAVKQRLALVRRIEQQQQKAVAGMVPGDETTLEHTLGYEQVAIDLTAFLAMNEPDPYLRQTYDFGLLEDFDHLYRYANLYDLLEGKDARTICDALTEMTPGRPTIEEHRHPFDDIRPHYEKSTVNPISRLHSMILVATEQQTMNFYMNMGNRYQEPIARSLYQEIAMIEEQHVTQYGSLLDPVESWIQQELYHQYNECYLYWSFYNQETDLRVKALWELHLAMEIEHLRVAGDLLRTYEGIEPAELLPAEMPAPTQFQSMKGYVRNALASQIDLTSVGPSYVPKANLPEDARYFDYQRAVHGGGMVPSEQVIAERIARRGQDYRLETEGPNPVPRLRQKPAIRQPDGHVPQAQRG